jgi:hypothetical protein
LTKGSDGNLPVQADQTTMPVFTILCKNADYGLLDITDVSANHGLPVDRGPRGARIGR